MPTPDEERIANERGLKNAIFLIETQMRMVTELTATGQDAEEARTMLRKFMNLEAALRARADTLGTMRSGARAVA